MLQRRNWLFRLSVVFNAAAVLYLVAAFYLSQRPSDGWSVEGMGGSGLMDDGRAGEPSRRILLDIGSLPPSFVAPSTNTLGE
ncbi:hypothetical protein GE061_011862 [Apolygus lucorum]|uniref:Uncharacterized protein n=1 Tax=Apolygus lucorum TaxID=248454 RepID=A0A6A4JRH4_APOLU|nr:hypothetical protein GE061_011862 [Apolygus lucorum]